MAESTQHKLDRIRPPRVQITYDVETRGSFEKKELPFVVGIMADLSGKDDTNRVPLRDRKYMEIDRDNFNEILKAISPRVAVNGSELSFESLESFNPMSVLKQIATNDKFEKRTRLSDMAAKLDGNVKLQAKFLETLTDDAKRKEMKGKVDALKALVAAATEDKKPNPESPVTPPEVEGGKKK